MSSWCKKPFLKLLEISLILSLAINLFLGYLYWKSSTYKDVDVSVLETFTLPRIMLRYREEGFRNTLIPTKSPFGGTGYEFTEITATFKSPYYYQRFGTQHLGIDIIPTKEYYTKSKAYRLAKVPVVFATHNGTVRYLYDQYGANYIVITSPTNRLRTLYVHLRGSYVKTGDKVVAGQPIGIMGATGNVTGSHVHYAVQIKNDNGYWEYQDPQDFIF